MARHKTTAQAIGLVTVATLAAKLLGVVREALQANAFGTTVQFDLYSTAYNHTIYLFTTLAYALCVAAVPIISKKLAEGKDSAERVAGTLMSVCLVLSLLLCGVGSLLIQMAPIGQWLGVEGESLDQLRRDLQICLLTLPLIVMIYLLVSVLQSMGHYSLQGSMSLPYNLALIVYLALFARVERMEEFVIIVCLAWLLQLAWLLPSIRQERLRIRPVLCFRSPELRLFARTAIVTLFTTSIFLWCYLADANTVSSLSEGAVSAVYYADKLFTPVATTLIYSISIVLFPKYNQEYTQSDHRGYKNYVGGTLSNTLFVILPFSALFSAFSAPMVRVLFERGSFDADSTGLTAGVFSMYALGMAGFCILDLVNKAYYTMRRTLAPLLINALVLVLNLILNRLLAGRGVPGLIALTTSISLSVGGILALVCFFRGSEDALQIRKLLTELFSAALMGGLAVLCSSLLTGLNQSPLIIVGEYLLLGGAGVCLYGVLCWLLGDRDVLVTIFNHFRKRGG